MPTKIEKDAITGKETTGHEWDGIKELDTPLPKWWALVFYATIAWALAYSVLYPSWPWLSGYFHGVLGYSTRAQIELRLADQKAQRAPMLDRIKAATPQQIERNPDLLNFAIAGGHAAFADNCVPCHGPGGAGSKGFPNLADDDWLWGGDLDNIYKTISFGIRNANASSRQSAMPRFGVDNILKPEQINDVAEYVLSFTGKSTDPVAAGRGAQVFAENCAACHGDKGQGNIEIGAKQLNNGIWLYGGDKKTIVETITYARNSSMPAWSERLDEPTIKMLAIYVHSLGGGK
ncbi:MAG TPA: cytochrome-c oxidase, cbb3-type subunit III [Alphaproteobacteria bacterium]|nr:cytochrome-c oxidase, cbb3-type subunit III [Alphaproteobacteria bacterium]